MQTKIIGIGILAVMVGITIIGASYLIQDDPDGLFDKYSIDSDTLSTKLQNNEPILIVDIRTAEQYMEGHMDGASHDNYLDKSTLEKRVKTIQNRLPEVALQYNLVLIDEDGSKARHAAKTMTEMGIHTFYLSEGMDNFSERTVSGLQTIIDSEELIQRITANDDLYLLDVREPDELLTSKIDGVVNIPLAQIFEPNGMDNIPTDKTVVVICGSGNRATIATYALAQNDIDFQVLEGGMKTWDSHLEQMGM